MNKRLLIAILCLIVMSLAGCGNDVVELVEVEIEQISEISSKEKTDDSFDNNSDSQIADEENAGDDILKDSDENLDEQEETETVVISTETKSSDGRNIIRIGVVGSPATDILQVADEKLAYSDYCIEMVTFKNFNEVNDRIRSGEIYGSLCENQVLMESYNNINDAKLTLAERVFISPLAIFPCKGNSIKNIANGAVIAVLQGDVNVARTLYLLEQKGLMEIKEGAMYQATMEDVTSNPYNISIEQVDLENGWPNKEQYDFVVSDYNRALLNGIDPQSSLAEENRNSKIFDLFAVGLVVRADNRDDAKTKLILDAINSDEVEEMIETGFYRSVLDYK